MNEKKTLGLVAASLIVALVLSLASLSGTAASTRTLSAPGAYAVSWHVVAGGGGPASGGNIRLRGTVGQPATGRQSGGNFRLGTGYWYGAEVIPPTPAQRLTYMPHILKSH